jgi:uncharacterized protein (TIGR02996 family)
MLEIHYRVDEYETLRTFTTILEQVTIGSDGACDLVLEGLAPIHCRLWHDASARWVVGPVGVTLHNGVEIAAPTYIGPADRLQLGSTIMQVVPVVVEASEQALIEAARDELEGRSVYADWLEERGQWDRAEFLRLTMAAADMEPDDPRFGDTTTRIQKLAPCLDVSWRMQLASEVEGCKQLRREFTCNMTWEQLGRTEDPLVRTCGSCSSQVYYCTTEAEAKQHTWDGHCIVVDVSVDRLVIRNTAEQPAVVPQPPMPSIYNPLPPPPAEIPLIPRAPGMYMPPVHITHPRRPCPQCRATVPAGFRFCSQCGTPS